VEDDLVRRPYLSHFAPRRRGRLPWPATVLAPVTAALVVPASVVNKGDIRQNVFELQYWDGSRWVSVFDGKSSGTTTGLQSFDFTPVQTPKVRCLGHGYNGGKGPDRSDRNQALNNTIGPDVTAEHVDIKEGTQSGVVRGNTFNGDDCHLGGADGYAINVTNQDDCPDAPNIVTSDNTVTDAGRGLTNIDTTE
jgi:hypothetical protein